MKTRLGFSLILIFIHFSVTSECPEPIFTRTFGVETIETNQPLFKLTKSSILDCANFCINISSCAGFFIDHKNDYCFGFEDNEIEFGVTGPKTNPKFTSDLFRKICFNQSQSCGNLIWSFERTPKSTWTDSGLIRREIGNVTKEEECVEFCLSETNFTCFSFSYNFRLKKCQLSNSSRLFHSHSIKDEPNWVYADNLCNFSHFSMQCGNDQRINISLTSVARALPVDDLKICVSMCEQEKSFVCQAYSFDAQQRICSLSPQNLSELPPLKIYGENEITFGSCVLSSKSAQNDLKIRGKKQVGDLIFPRCPLTKLTHIGYEKVTGYRLAIFDDRISQTPLYSNDSRGITEECLRLCTEESCLAFTLDYAKIECNTLTPEESPELSENSFSYFRPLCLPEDIAGQCNKLWFIDRLPHHHLNVDFYEVIGSISRDDCEARCLEDSTRCRSANYQIDQKECALTESDRHTRPSAFVMQHGSEYLENQCFDHSRVIRPRQFSTSCIYGQPIRDKYLVFVDKTVTAASESDCRISCDSELLFNCRSYSFVPRQPSVNQCFLSSDTTNSPGAQLREMPGAVYVERTCSQTTLPQTQQPPVFPPPKPPTGPFPGLPGPPNIVNPPIYPNPYPQRPGLPGPSYPAPPGIPGPHYPGPPGVFPGGQFPGQFPGQYPGVSPRCYYPTDFTFEKTMGMVPRPSSFLARADRLPLSGPTSIAPDCVHSCTERDMHCIGFVLQYPMKEPPACVAFDRGLGFDRGVLVPRQNAAYMEKVCLHGRRCGKLWTFERVVGFELEGSDTKVLQFVPTKEECEDQCLSETTFECRSAEYIYSLRLCRLSSETRRSRPETFRFVGPDVDYLENQCASEPVQCEYTEFPAKMLPFADRFVAEMSSLEDCQQRCDKEREFLCRSVTWNHISSDCLLSSDDRYSTPMGINAIVDRADWVYSEKGNCGQVHVDCSPNEMTVRVVFGSPFTGRIYAKGNPQLCTQPGANQLQVALPVPLGVQCGTVQEAPGIYTNEIVVQQHPLIMTDNDKSYRVVCSFAVTDQVVTMDSGGRLDRPGGLDVINDKGASGPQQIVQNSAPSPDVRLRITARNGQDVSTVGIGDELLFRVDPEPRSSFGIFARNLIAKSEYGDQLPLLDHNGCPTDLNIFPHWFPSQTREL